MLPTKIIVVIIPAKKLFTKEINSTFREYKTIKKSFLLPLIS